VYKKMEITNAGGSKRESFWDGTQATNCVDYLLASLIPRTVLDEGRTSGFGRSPPTQAAGDRPVSLHVEERMSGRFLDQKRLVPAPNQNNCEEVHYEQYCRKPYQNGKKASVC
jgi:hypothetical protein